MIFDYLLTITACPMKLDNSINKNFDKFWLHERSDQLSRSIAGILEDIGEDQQKLLWYAKELALTSDYAFKDYVSWEKNTDGSRDRNK